MTIRATDPQRRQELTFVACMVLLLCFCLIAAEAFLRSGANQLLGPEQERVRPNELYRQIGYREEGISTYRMMPNTSYRHISTNKFGLRGPNLQIPKPQGRVRIAILGTSTVLGASLEEAQTLPAKVVEHLRSQNPACSFDYISVSGSAYTLVDHVWLLRNVLPEAEIDHIVILKSKVHRRLTPASDKKNAASHEKETVRWQPSILKRSALYFKIMHSSATKQEPKLRSLRDALSREHAALREIIKLLGVQHVWYFEFSNRRRGLVDETRSPWAKMARQEMSKHDNTSYSEVLKSVPPTRDHYYVGGSMSHYKPRGADLAGQLIAGQFAETYGSENNLCNSSRSARP